MDANRKYKILVADDERAGIDALLRILKPMYTVLVVKDGASALESANKSRPDIILLGIAMPGIDGFETLTRLKADDATRRIPVIFISERMGERDEERGFRLGAADYITKPFRGSAVRARVAAHLQTAEHIRAAERLCMIDELTNLPNRRSLNARLKMEWERATRDGSELSLLIIDVDKFKLFNDRFGHATGDELLRALSDVFRQSLLRAGDFAARWGGEEFVLLLPQTNRSGAIDVAERVRGNVEMHSPSFICSGDTARVTISIGVNTAAPAQAGSAEVFFNGADKALYKAKERGRNMVCFCEEPGGGPKT